LERLRRRFGWRECFVDHAEKFWDVERLGEIGACAGGKQALDLGRGGVGTL
jgi:hypothetical protein